MGLRLIKQDRTSSKVVEAGPETRSKIPYVTEKKAKDLVGAARTSVASQTDEDTTLTLSLIAEDLLRLEKRIDRLNRLRPFRWPEPDSRPTCPSHSHLHRRNREMERSRSL